MVSTRGRSVSSSSAGLSSHLAFGRYCHAAIPEFQLAERHVGRTPHVLPSLSPAAFAKSPVKLKNFVGAIDFSTESTSLFVLEGTASHLGRYSAHGEVDLSPGAEAGTLVGDGVVVFEAANGDLLVGVATWEVDAEV